MQQRYTSLITLIAFISLSNMAQANPRMKSISLEVANCYVGHERAQTEQYKLGKAEELKNLLAQVAGKDQVEKIILHAKQRQMDSLAAGVGIFGQPTQVVKKYCTSLDERVADALKIID